MLTLIVIHAPERKWDLRGCQRPLGVSLPAWFSVSPLRKRRGREYLMSFDQRITPAITLLLGQRRRPMAKRRYSNGSAKGCRIETRHGRATIVGWTCRLSALP
jgi:hypothetical protein